MKSLLQHLALSAVVAALVGCATPGMRDIETRQARISDDAHAAQAATKFDEPYFTEVDDIYVAGVGETIVHADRFATELDQPATFRRSYPVTLQVLAEYISATFGMKVVVTQDAVRAAERAAFDPAQALARYNASIEQSQGGQAPTQAPQPGQAVGFLVQYDGTLRGLLDLIAARTGNDWRIDPTGITVYHLDTRTFRIAAFPGSSAQSSTISNRARGGGQAGGGGGGGGGSGQQSTTSEVSSGSTTTVTSEINMFESAVETVTGMLSEEGRVARSPSTTSVTVTDVPVVLDRVEAYVKSLNAQITEQVYVDVKVYSVEISANERFGIDWDIVWESLSGRYQAITDTVGLSQADDGAFGIGVIDPTYNYAGTNLLLTALSEQGDLAVETTVRMPTLSGQSVPVQVTEETSYQASVQTTLVPDAGAQTTRTAASVTTGFTMNAMPVVIDSEQILMQLQITLSTLRDLRQIGSGDNLIEVPQVDSRQFLPRVKVKSGSTLVLSGFEQERLRSTARGIGKPSFSLAGGGKDANRRRTVLIVLLTPRIIG
jgi:type IVB pilus formation R64 PilN family outer membrane protein